MTRIKFLEMLEFMRPAWTVYEEAFIDRYIKPLKPTQDAFGNFILDVGAKPNILWSSHTDTVHRTSGLQQVVVDKNHIARVKFPSVSSCLGADCTTGVYIMIEMINAGVEGRYIFHRAEEIGLRGSSFIADKTPDVLKGIDAAIAFDRKGLTDIITHMGYRTSSNEFAESLALALDMNYKPSANGMGTDTKSYIALVPECTNISVGYSNQHMASESQDLVFLDKLVAKMKNFDSSSLVIKRTPEKGSYPTYQYQGGQHTSSYWNKPPEDVFDLVRTNPKSVSTLLEMAGWDFETLGEAVKLIQAKREEEIDIWGDDDGFKLPTKLIAAPKRKSKKVREQKLKTGIS